MMRNERLFAAEPKVFVGYRMAQQEQPRGLIERDALVLRSLAATIAQESGAPLSAGWMLHLADRIEAAANEP